MKTKLYSDNHGNETACYEGFVASSSKVAAFFVGGEPDGTDDRKEFGKRFEMIYEQFCFQWDSIMTIIAESIGNGTKLRPLNRTEIESVDVRSCPGCGKPVPVVSNFKDDHDKIDWFNDNFATCERCHRTWHDDCDGLPMPYSENQHHYDPVFDGYYCIDCLPAIAMEKIKSTWIEGIQHPNIVTSQYMKGEDDIGEAMLIAKAFIWSGIHGQTPPTRYRHVRDDLFIAAKPDLVTSNPCFKGGNMNDWNRWDFDEHYIEFKIYEGGEFAVMQSKVFSWVLDKPVTLVTWDGEKVAKNVVDGRDLDVSVVPEALFHDDGQSGGHHRLTTDDGKIVFDAWRLIKARVPTRTIVDAKHDDIKEGTGKEHDEKGVNRS